MSKGASAIAALAALFMASAATAEPAQPSPEPVKVAVEPARIVEPARMVLASATPVSVPQPRKEDQLALAPEPKKRTARVTTCRCGDPDPR